LITSVVSDLRTQKVPNWLVLTMAGIALVYQLLTNGLYGLTEGGLGLLVAVTISLPLVLVRGLGAGDMKVLAVLGLSTNWSVAVWTAVYSIIWGALLGVLQAIFNGQALALAKNTVGLLTRKSSGTEARSLHRIPYTLALFFGWLTYVSLNGGLHL
jgi:prepilin peptidase CpaA